MTNNWIETIKDLGEVKKKSTVTVLFKGTDSLKKVINVTASCGCTTPVFDSVQRTISVSFKTGAIPFHLRKQGFYLANKKLTVHYEDGTFEELFIKAKVVE